MPAAVRQGDPLVEPTDFAATVAGGFVAPKVYISIIEKPYSYFLLHRYFGPFALGGCEM